MKIPRLISTLLVLLAACAPGTNTPLATEAAPPMLIAAPTLAPSPEPSPTPLPASNPLPHSLYFLQSTGEKSQVWRMQADGITTGQVTDEEAGVDSFAVSPLDGSLAFVSANQLFLMDGDGTNHRLIADDSQLDEAEKGTSFYGLMSDPVFSPDGQTLAYSLDGLHLYDLATSEDTLVLKNLGNLLGEPFVFTKELYSPVAWSPDGSMLLFSMGYYEGSTLAVMEPGAKEQFRRLWSSGPVCCQFSWAADSRAVLVANPSYTVVEPGLWSYDAETGKETTLVGGMREDGRMDFVAAPFQLDSGELLFFYAELERFDPDVGIPMVLVRSDPTGSNITQVRPEVFDAVRALWAPDGSSAVISGRCCGGGNQLILVRPDGSPLQVLAEAGEGVIFDMAWGP